MMADVTVVQLSSGSQPISPDRMPTLVTKNVAIGPPDKGKYVDGDRIKIYVLYYLIVPKKLT